MADNQNFIQALQNIKIPVLILDQKWHRLFALGGKPDEVVELETTEGDLLKRQAVLKQELKDLKKVKESLMTSVMSNMEGTSDLVSKKLDEDKRLLEECNERIDAANDELLDIPSLIDETNYSLMLATMDYCYSKLRLNSQEANEITDWINNVRIQLKKNVIRKKNREINNKEIYSYMHDVFGMEILNIFDLQNEDILLNFEEDIEKNSNKIENNSHNKTKQNNSSSVVDEPNVELENVDLVQVSKETKADEDAKKIEISQQINSLDTKKD